MKFGCRFHDLTAIVTLNYDMNIEIGVFFICCDQKLEFLTIKA
jgi:hypothetical protein